MTSHARSAVGIGSLNHLGIHTHEAQFVCHEFSGALHMFGGDALGGDRLQRDLFGQYLDDAVPIGFDARTNLVSGERCMMVLLYMCVSGVIAMAAPVYKCLNVTVTSKHDMESV